MKKQKQSNKIREVQKTQGQLTDEDLDNLINRTIKMALETGLLRDLLNVSIKTVTITPPDQIGTKKKKRRKK